MAGYENLKYKLPGKDHETEYAEISDDGWIRYYINKVRKDKGEAPLYTEKLEIEDIDRDDILTIYNDRAIADLFADWTQIAR